jgi:hypothetical protein
MKKIIIAITILMSQTAFALPEIPADCFTDKVYCHSHKVLKDPNRKKYFQINFFAELSADEFESIEEIEEIFSDFPAWIDYTQDSENVDLTTSLTRFRGDTEAGEHLRIHEAEYTMKAPRPLNRVNVKEVSIYKKTAPFEGAAASWFFYLDRSYKELKGVKDKKGELHLVYLPQQNVYRFYVLINVWPEINILHKVAAPYVEKALVSIFLGMFDLN